MSYDMIMNLPIQDRRALIRKHNIEQDEIKKEYERENGGGDSMHIEGDSVNTYARLEQSNQRGGG